VISDTACVGVFNVLASTVLIGTISTGQGLSATLAVTLDTHLYGRDAACAV
jgi:hypothetical protein